MPPLLCHEIYFFPLATQSLEISIYSALTDGQIRYCRTGTISYRCNLLGGLYGSAVSVHSRRIECLILGLWDVMPLTCRETNSLPVGVI